MTQELSPEMQAAMKRIGEHQAEYISSGGTKGHIFSFAWGGGRPFTTCLLLRTTGRKSGEPRISALIYGNWKGEVVIVGSKGGFPKHPAWYLNIRDGGEVAIQIATQAYKASWREPQGEERKAVWQYMEDCFPPYKAYQAATDREIPIVMLTPTQEIPVFRG